jgi:uncharacterized membrane protein
LKLRKAFRLGYFLFLAVLFALMAAFAISAVDGDLVQLIGNLLANNRLLLWLGLALGLSVPAFFAVWSLIGSALLGPDGLSRMEGAAD